MPLKKQSTRGGAASAKGAGAKGQAGSGAGSGEAAGGAASATAASANAATVALTVAAPASRPAATPRALDPVWGVDLRQPLPPKPVQGVTDLLAPVLDEPLPVVIDQPPLPPIAELMVLHRAEAEAEFEEPPVIGAKDEPAVPGRFAAGMAVLPHIDFPA
jgi:hypothetical protein